MTNTERVTAFWQAFLAVDDDNGAAVSALVTDGVTFRGSLGVSTTGTAGIVGYCRQAKSVFEGFDIELGDAVAEGNVVAVRMVFSGVHCKPLLGIAPTGKPIVYDGMAWMTLEGDRFTDIWVMGDAAEWMGLFLGG